MAENSIMPGRGTSPAERERLETQIKLQPPPAPPALGAGSLEVMRGRVRPSIPLSSSPNFDPKAPVTTSLSQAPAEFKDTPDTGANMAPANPPPASAPPAVQSAALLPVQKVSESVAQNIIPADISTKLQGTASELENSQIKLNSTLEEQARISAQAQQEQINYSQEKRKALELKQQEIQTRREAALQEYDNKLQQYQNMSIENPWSNMSTGSKIMAALSIGLGGMARNTDGSNPALAILDQAVTQDIDIQKANMDKKKGELTAIQQYGQELRQMGVDEANITEGMIAMGERQLAAKLDKIKNQLGPNDPRSPQVEIMKNTLLEKSFDRNRQIADLYAQKKSTAVQNDFISMGPAGGTKPPSDTILKDLSAKRESLIGYEKLENMPTSEIGPVMGRLRNAFNNWIPTKGFAEQATTVQNNILATLKAITGAQMTNAEYDRIAGMLPSMTDNPQVFKEKIKALKEPLAASYDRDVDTYGAYYDTSTFRRTPNKKVTTPEPKN